MDDAEKFEALKHLYVDAELVFEQKMPLVYLPALKFPSGKVQHETDALLCPRKHSSASYPTRLFLEKQPPNGGRNWKNFQVIGRSWRACSWKDVSETLSWPEILFAHLRAFK